MKCHFSLLPSDICRECMQETPRPAYPVCSPSTIPSYPVPSVSSGQSPPTTPGLPPQQTQSPVHIQTPGQIHLANSYSGQSISTPLTVSTDAISSPTTSRTLMTPGPEMGNCPLTPEATSTCTPGGPATGRGMMGKSGDDIVVSIMRDLMGHGQECSSSTGCVGILHEKEIEPRYLYANPSPYIPVASPSAASDQPCYSPVTPVQSPSTCKSLHGYVQCTV